MGMDAGATFTAPPHGIGSGAGAPPPSTTGSAGGVLHRLVLDAGGIAPLDEGGVHPSPDGRADGLGLLIDADLAKESARLQALPARQHLAAQTLSIANRTPQALLSLFGDRQGTTTGGIGCLSAEGAEREGRARAMLRPGPAVAPQAMDAYRSKRRGRRPAWNQLIIE